MGIIQRQSVKQTMVNYLATALAGISTLFIYPLEEGLYGLWLALLGMAAFFLPFASFGVNAVTIRFFPHFRDPERDHQGFLPFLLILSLVFFGLFTLLLFAFERPLLNVLEKLQFNVGLIREHIFPILVLTLLGLLNLILTNHISNFQRIVVPAIINNLWPKVFLPVAVFMGWKGWLASDEFIQALLLMQVVGVGGLLVYLAFLGELRLKPHLDIWRSGRLREMSTFGLYGMLGSLGSIFAFRLDHIMIALLIGLNSTGIYGIAQFIGNSIEMPTRSIYAIAGPIIAKAWKSENLEEIRKIYQKASLNLLLLGLPLFGLLVLCLDDLLQLTAKYETLSAVATVVYLIGLGKLVDMACSVNGQIISYSRFFRYNLVAILVLGGVNVVLNYLFIPRYGVVGAAWASFIAISAYNLIRSLFVWWKMDMQPLSWRTGVALVLAFGATALAWFIPDFEKPIFDLFQNSLLLAVFYLPAVLGLRLSPDLNNMVSRKIGAWKLLS